MLTRYQIESELSLAYLHAVAAKAGFAVDVPHVDTDSVDAIISAKGRLDETSVCRSPRIEVQLKATVNWKINSENCISYPLPIKNYQELTARTMVPRLLIVLCLPELESDWLMHSEKELSLRNCAFWVNLKGQKSSENLTNQTVYIPLKNMLTPIELKTLMVKASRYDEL